MRHTRRPGCRSRVLIRKTVHDAAINNQSPVGAGAVHFVNERSHMRDGNVRIQCPWQTSTLAFMVDVGPNRFVLRLPWMLATPASWAPERANSSTVIPPKKYPTAASRPSTCGC